MDREAAWRGVFVIDQVFGSGMEIIEDILLFVLLTSLVPSFTIFTTGSIRCIGLNYLPSTDVSDGVNTIEVGQPSQSDRAKRRLDRDVESSVSGE